MASKSSKKGKNTRKPCARGQALRTMHNKLARVNRDRAKSGKQPLDRLAGYDRLTGKLAGASAK